MMSTHQQNGSVFTNLPEDLVYNILCWCSPIDEIRAAASCKCLRKVYQEHNNPLTSHSAIFNGETDGNVPLCPQNTKQLMVNVGRINTRRSVADVYREVQACIDQTVRNGIMHLIRVRDMGIEHSIMPTDDLPPTAQQCIQQLLHLLPNLKTLWIGTYQASWLWLACNNLHVLQKLFMLSLELVPSVDQLVRIPDVMPNLDTLCLTICGSMDATWFQPLSQLPHLRYLRVSSSLPIDLFGISSLQQLQSLSLCNIRLDRPEELSQLAMLNVTSLTLQWMGVSQLPANNTVPEQPQANLCWSQLRRVSLGGWVTERILQWMLLPHPAAAGVEVKESFSAYDQFVSEYKQSMQPQAVTGHAGRCTVHGMCYLIDAPPVLGPEYLAALRLSSLQLMGHSALEALQQLQSYSVPLQELYLVPQLDEDMAFPTLQQLTFASPARRSIDSWYTLFSNCPLLTHVIFKYEQDVTIMNSMKTAAQRLGITVVRQEPSPPAHFCLIRP